MKKLLVFATMALAVSSGSYAADNTAGLYGEHGCANGAKAFSLVLTMRSKSVSEKQIVTRLLAENPPLDSFRRLYYVIRVAYSIPAHLVKDNSGINQASEMFYMSCVKNLK